MSFFVLEKMFIFAKESLVFYNLKNLVIDNDCRQSNILD